jgi:transposase InsO family protein
MINNVSENPHKFPGWRVENNILFKHVKNSHPELFNSSSMWKTVVPKDKRKEVLNTCHKIPAAGHVGVYKTTAKVQQNYFWPKIISDITKYIRSCTACAQNKVEQKLPSGLMGDRPEISEPWQTISLDYIGPLPRSKKGNTHVLVVTDYFSKFVVLFPCRSAKAKSLVQFVEEGIFLNYGAPDNLMCDNGVQMKSKEFQSLCAKYNVNIFYTALYNPRANPTERVNRVLKTMIRTYVNQNNHKTWDENLAAITCALRTSPNETTGYSPYSILYGHEHRLFGRRPIQQIPLGPTNITDYVKTRQEGFSKLYKEIQRRIEKTRTQNQQRYNLRRRPLAFSPGDLVWRKNKSLSDAVNYYSAKLAPLYLGPFRIKRKIGSWTYELKDEAGASKGIWHVQDLKIYT